MVVLPPKPKPKPARRNEPTDREVAEQREAENKEDEIEESMAGNEDD